MMPRAGARQLEVVPGARPGRRAPHLDARAALLVVAAARPTDDPRVLEQAGAVSTIALLRRRGEESVLASDHALECSTVSGEPA